MNELPIVEILWIDSMTHSGWRDYEEALEKKVASCRSVGYIISKTDDTVTIAQNIAEIEEQVSEITCIPVVAIQVIVELERINE